MIAAMRGLSLITPFGKITYRLQDQQSTMGAYVGRTAVENGVGKMVDYLYVDGASVQPSDAEVAKLRPAEK